MKTDPLPWSYERTDSVVEGEEAFVIQSPAGDVAEVNSPAATEEGNAALICRAVNNFAALVAACERLMRQPTSNPLDMSPEERKELRAAHDEARAALAAAR